MLHVATISAVYTVRVKHRPGGAAFSRSLQDAFLHRNLAACKLLKRYVAIGDDGERLPVELDSLALAGDQLL